MIFSSSPETPVKHNIENMSQLCKDFFKSARDFDLETLQKCISDGVDINAQDKENQNTALHNLLSDDHFRENSIEKAEECLRILLEHEKTNPNLKNGKGQIPLDLVVENMVPDSMAKLLISHGGSFAGPNGIQKTELAMKLIHKMPVVVESALDQAVKFTSKPPTKERDTVCFPNRERNARQAPTIELDWRCIIYNLDAPKKDGRNWHETRFLHDILSGGPEAHKRILTHPVVQAFLQLKHPLYWRNFGVYYFIWIILTFAMYLSFIWILYNDSCRYNDGAPSQSTTVPPVSGSSTPIYDSSASGEFQCSSRMDLTALAYIILLLYTTGPFWLEFRRLLAIGPGLYVREWKNYIIIIASFIVAATLWPALSLKDNYTLTWQYPIAALGMLVGSLVILIQLAPVTVTALYLEMVFKIFRRIVLATIILSPILLGFFFAFRILITSSTIGPFKLLTMIVSDNDYEGMMDSDRGVFYNIVAYFFFTAFIVLVIIVVLNFLIGLAVSDIQELKEAAKSANSIALVRSLYLMDVVYGREWKRNSVILNGAELEFRFCPLDETDKRLPEPLKLELLKIARQSCSSTAMPGTVATVKESPSKVLKIRESTRIDFST